MCITLTIPLQQSAYYTLVTNFHYLIDLVEDQNIFRPSSQLVCLIIYINNSFNFTIKLDLTHMVHWLGFQQPQRTTWMSQLSWQPLALLAE